MFDTEIRHFFRCDTCPDDHVDCRTAPGRDKDDAAGIARLAGWDIRDDQQRCWQCVRDGLTERVS